VEAGTGETVVKRRFKDVRKASAPAKLVRFHPGESHVERHRRRLGINQQGQQAVDEFCTRNELKLAITNNWHHWSIYHVTAQPGDPQWAEWWPSSAKLVFRKQWRKGIHCHDYTQLIAECEKQLALETQNALRAASPTGCIGA
jgi:hypothetical protein